MRLLLLCLIGVGLGCGDSTGPGHSRSNEWAALIAGAKHTCGLTRTGEAYCWGSSFAGVLGTGTIPDGSTPDSPLPAAVTGGLHFTALTAGYGHTCGLTGAGEAYCWGWALVGQLGEGSTTDVPIPHPVAVAGGLRFTSLTAGNAHTCGLTGAGVAYCWGSNRFGQLGNGATTDRIATPAAVSGGLRFTILTAGYSHVCGLVVSGAAYCWGAAGENAGSVPVAVPGGMSFITITAGAAHTCGLVSDGAAFCWGDNRFGQFGNGATGYGPIVPPVAVAGGLRFTALTAGYGHTCGLVSDGVAYCWGDNSYGPLGNGSTTEDPILTPVVVSGGLSFLAITAGGLQEVGSPRAQTCGLTRSGAAYCWGDNYYGQLGNGTMTNSPVPVAVSGWL